MHFTYAKGILSAENGMNIYRGCQHGCIYCDSRSRCYHFTHDFEDIAVKKNAPELLEKALASRRRKCMIGTGAMCDPYMPVEEEIGMTRKCLEIIKRFGFGVAVQTKSDRVLRDEALLVDINERAKAVVQITLTTYDEALCGLIEPNVCGTERRYRALKRFQTLGVPTVVWISPILPYINDTEDNLRGLLAYCFDAGVRGILWFGAGVTLRDGDREYFYDALDKHFPGVKQRYIKRFGLSYEYQSENSPYLDRLFHEECEKRGVLHDQGKVFRYLRAFPGDEAHEQLSLFQSP